MSKNIRDRIAGAGSIAPDAPLMRLLRRGIFARGVCSDIGCQETTTARCEYEDRRNEQCPSNGCARHIHAFRRRPYCGAHIASVSPAPVGEHKIALALDWLGRAIDDDVVAMLRSIAAESGENLMGEGVRFGAVGLERIRIWERTWKTYSELGVGCRVSIGIADKDPDIVQIRVNSSVVTTLVTPWETSRRAQPRDFSDRLVAPVIVPMRTAVEIWLNNTMIKLEGTSRLPRH